MPGERLPLNEYEGLHHIWDEPTGYWWFAVVDVVALLSEATNPSRYWADMKRWDESGQLLAKCEKFPMRSRKNNRLTRPNMPIRKVFCELGNPFSPQGRTFQTVVSPNQPPG